MEMSEFFPKNLFFEIEDVPLRTRWEGVERCEHFADKGSTCDDFVWMSFMDGL